MANITLALGGSVPPECRGGAVTIGNFDGVHLGHQALLANTVRRAGCLGGPPVAVTFSQHPLQLLRPATFEPVLTTLHDRIELLRRHGAQHVIVLETSHALLELSARRFFDEILVDCLGARAIVEGFNFGFGKNREGSVETLKALAQEAGIEVDLIPAVEILGKPASSSRVRHEVQAGNVSLARALLGRPFRITGTVGTGQKRGRSLGFPTANLSDVPTLVPGEGVYAVTVHGEAGDWPGAANIGTNPTFGEHTHKVEVHLIGFSGELYGKRLSLDFLEKLRDTRTFAGVDDLKNQLAIDVRRAAQIHGAVSATR